MRAVLVVGLAIAGCYVSKPDTLPKRRPLVTDQLPYLVERERVRAWHLEQEWCLRRTWAHSDEFVICNPRPYLNWTTPAMYALVRYNGDDRSVAYAVFTPVPCRMYGKCDAMGTRTVYAAEHDFVDHSEGLDDRLVDRGRGAPPYSMDLPAMQERMFDALVPELRGRFGRATWEDPRHFGMTWTTATSEIGLFVAGTGGWVIETHEMRGAPP